MKPSPQFLLLFLVCLPLLQGLRILFVLPCYGGHFGTMTPLITSLSESHDVTVLQTSPSCQKKLAPFRARSSFKVIEEDLTFKDMHFSGFIQGAGVNIAANETKKLKMKNVT